MPLPCALSIGSAVVLAVCSAAANATGPDRVEPGQWRTVVTYTSVTGLPPPMIRAMTARPHAFDGCTTDGDINGVVREAISAGGDMTCSEHRGSASNGVITGSATCHDDRGSSGHLSINGTYTTTHVTVTGVLNAQTPLGPVSEHIRWVSDHTSAACTSKN